MQFMTFNGPTEVLSTTVVLAPTKDNNLTLFHCPRCGTGVAKIGGIVIKIFSGLIPTKDVFVGQTCLKSTCKQVYTFQTEKIKPYTAEGCQLIYTEVSLLYLPPNVNYFNCVVCGKEVIHYNENTKPSQVVCSRESCQKKYNFTEVVTLDQ